MVSLRVVLRFAGLALALVAAGGAGGCATVTRGTTSQIQIESEPSGAQVRTSLNHSCTAPCTISVNRRDEFTVIGNLPGHQETKVEVKTRIAGEGAAGFAGNILIGGLVGMGVDAATGATLEHTPNPVRLVLTPVPPPLTPPVSTHPRREPIVPRPGRGVPTS